MTRLNQSARTMAENRRCGFSLMEMIIATAVLAGSGAALFALVGQASQFALRAEQRTVTLQLAQTVMDEFLAEGADTEATLEGTFLVDPRWAYQIEESEIAADAGAEATSTGAKLKRITVIISHAEDELNMSADSEVVRLVRWTRFLPKLEPTVETEPASMLPTPIPEVDMRPQPLPDFTPRPSSPSPAQPRRRSSGVKETIP